MFFANLRASYNAGPNRIAKLRKMAEAEGFELTNDGPDHGAPVRELV